MKAVLISIQPNWVAKIAKGEKTIEVRKTAPKCEVPFKCYIYCTKGDNLWLTQKGVKSKTKLAGYLMNGKVIGEFICDKVFLLHPYTYDGGNADLRHRKFIQTFEGSSKENEILAATCLPQDEMFDYIGADNYGYGWHISDLKIYDKPKTLAEFYKCGAESFEELSDTEDLCSYCSRTGFCEGRWCDEAYQNYLDVDFALTRAPSNWCYVEELS